jgi:hypothetical protein
MIGGRQQRSGAARRAAGDNAGLAESWFYLGMLGARLRFTPPQWSGIPDDARGGVSCSSSSLDDLSA